MIPAGQTQYVPYVSGWPAAWSGTPSTWPTTTGFRPDIWQTGTAPVYNQAVTTASSVLSGITALNINGSVTGGTGYIMKDDVKPTGWSTASEVWLRIENSGGTLTFKGYAGTTAPSGASDPGWFTIGSTMSMAAWNSQVLAGPCVQSGSSATATTVTFTDLKVTTSLTSPSDVLDATDWENQSGTGDDLSRYLASQYQVFFGTREITEDFFTWKDPTTGRRLADEQWFYNTREFWSQSRWWDTTTPGGVRVEKDPFTAPATTFTSTKYRELLAKTTVLDLDLETIQNYLKQRTMGDAVADRIPSVGSVPDAVTSSTATLGSRFNGMIYAARTNRYPWNPNTNALLSNTLTGQNPWSIDSGGTWLNMRNSLGHPGDATALAANGVSLDTWTDPGLSLSGVHLLQPYPTTVLPVAPAFKPQRWHHGVRLINAANIAWNYPTSILAGNNSTGGRNWNHVSTPDFGTCKLSVVTPNQLYVKGSLNVDQHQVRFQGATVYKPTPLAIIGDQVTLLSNAWTDLANQQSGLTVTNVGGAPSVQGTGTLACATFGTPASATTYQAGIATNNQPTTRDRVREGQGAPFIDTLLFLENWNNVPMNYLGSLVVLDSRRYSQAFLHDSYKTYGTTPFGLVASGPTDSWLTVFAPATLDWIGRSPAVFSEPTRTYAFNYDFLTAEGTPPSVPFGVSSTGAGGWARIVE